MVRRFALLAPLAIVALLFAFAPVGSLFAQTDPRCFPETGFCISGRIREFWEQNGGLPVFGFPTGPQQEERIEGRPFQVQWFQRNRLELHPENARPYDVLLGRLGVDRLVQQGRDWFTFPRSTPQPGCRSFPETGHNICGEILNTWRANGLEFDGLAGKSEAESLALFGMPISGLQTEAIEGRDYQVQWFERARFELHPENQPPFHVLLGLLGNEVRAGVQPPPPPPGPPPLPPPTFDGCQFEPNPTSAPHYPVKIVAIDKGAETVQLQNVSPEPVDLNGWHMCSLRGSQEHPISGRIEPGETRSFPGPSGNIWNNDEDDDGALYNPDGQLVSYWDD